jgi:uncharacterized membrane protein YbaN (DUF454 family)
MYKLLGFIFVGLAFIGLFLPLLPTTPFLLVAAGCFSKSSEKWHKWLLQSKTFGPLIHQWQTDRTISFKYKMISIFMIIASGIYAVGFSTVNIYLKCISAALILFGLIFVCRIKQSTVAKH